VNARLPFGLLLGLAVVPVAPTTALAQEPPRVRGLALPPAVFERIRRQPDAFELKQGWIQRAQRAAATSAAVDGTLRVAVILALFADSPQPHVTQEELQRVLFDGPYEHGTVTEYYDEASGGRFALHGHVLPWLRTGLTMQEVVGSEYGLGDDAQTQAYLVQALDVADPLVDFGLFDNDGPDGAPNSGDDDGAVDAVAFEFLEVAASCGGPGIWPHRWRIESWTDSTGAYVTNDPRFGGGAIVVNDYMVQSVVDCGGVEPQKATTIAHEMAHVLGLPDLYDRSQGRLPEQRRWVVGCWSLMAAGAWGCGSDDRVAWLRPTHLGAWEKEQLGWLAQVDEVIGVLDREFTLDPVLASERVLKIPLERGEMADTNEYLLVEYRTNEGFDLDLPASGVLVTHIDPQIPGNRPCDTCAQVYRVGLLEADGNNSLQRAFPEGGNRGEAGDAWGVAGPGLMTNDTYPSTRLTFGALSPVTIHEISIEGGVAHITISSIAVSTERLVQGLLHPAASLLTAEEREYFDRQGNGNGQYDVGDLRAYLRR
jgi:M6 family metalloprotease-like protein